MAGKRGPEVTYLTVRVWTQDESFGNNVDFIMGLLSDNAPEVDSVERHGEMHVVVCKFENGSAHRVGKVKLGSILDKFVKAKRIKKALLSTNEVSIT